MKRTIFWLLISFVTFALGVATAFIWLDARKLATEKSEAFPSAAQQIHPWSDLPILAYCELANNPEKYDGKIVRISSRLWYSKFGGYFFLDKNCYSEEKQTSVIFPDGERFKEGLEIENKIAKDIGLTEYHPWSFPDIIAVGKFIRVESSRKNDSTHGSTNVHFEILEVEKASKQ